MTGSESEQTSITESAEGADRAVAIERGILQKVAACPLVCLHCIGDAARTTRAGTILFGGRNTGALFAGGGGGGRGADGSSGGEKDAGSVTAQDAIEGELALRGAAEFEEEFAAVVG